MRGTRRKNKNNPEMLTEAKIQKVLKTCYMSQPEYFLENLFVFDWESDYLVKTKAGYWYEVEIKISLQDLKNDMKHKEAKFKLLEDPGENGLCPNYFSYCVPKELVVKALEIIPDYAGLYYVSGGYATCFRYPKELHGRKIKDEELNLTKKFYYNWRDCKDKLDAELIEDLRYQIRSLKAEFEAVAGYPISDDIN